MQCQHENCSYEGNPCYLLDDDPDRPSYHYCAEHAHDEGFCYGCGGFFAGIESFEFGTGFCENCRDDLNDDEDVEDDDLF